MPVLPEHVVCFSLSDAELHHAITYAYHVLTHHRSNRVDPLHQYIQVLVDELAERMVMQWLREHGKFAEPVSDKGATNPELSHEIWVTDIRGMKVRAAIHTFLSTHKAEMAEMLNAHSLSIETSQMCGINFSVVYWLQLHEKPRIKMPSLQNSAIVGWASDKNFRESLKSPTSKYAALKFADLRPVEELLQFLV